MNVISKRNLWLIACGCVALMLLGAWGRRKYLRWRYFREAPDEVGVRPVIDAPGNGLDDEPAVSRSAAPTVIKPGLARRTDGTIVWEAEWANRITGSYECMPADDTGGGMALWSRQGSGRSLQMHYHRPHRNEGDLGSAEYHFALPKPGRYRLYMRIRAPDHCGNSCWVGMDRRRRLHCYPDGFDSDFHGRRLHWPEEMFMRWLWLEDTGRLFELDAGAHFLRVEVREDGMAIDQVALVPEGGDEPSGVQQPTMIPRGAGDVAFVRLAVDHQCLPRSGAATANGHLWVRSNSTTNLPLVVRLAAGDAEIRPAAEVRCELGPDAPFAYLPVQAILGEPARLGAVEFTATISTPHDVDVKAGVARRLVERPLEWWVLGPLGREADLLVRRELMSAAAIDFGKPHVQGKEKFEWTLARSPDHFGHLGAVDFTKLFGAREECVVYAATMVDVEKAGVYRITAAGDDTMELRIDGKRVVEHHHERTVTDTLRPVELALTAGRHLLVARVEQRSGEWQMVVRWPWGSGLNIQHSGSGDD